MPCVCVCVGGGVCMCLCMLVCMFVYVYLHVHVYIGKLFIHTRHFCTFVFFHKLLITCRTSSTDRAIILSPKSALTSTNIELCAFCLFVHLVEIHLQKMTTIVEIHLQKVTLLP